MWNYINSDYFTNKAFVVMHVPGKHGLFGAISLEVISLTITVKPAFCFGCRDTFNILVLLLFLFAKCSGMKKRLHLSGMNCDEFLGLVHARFSFTFNYCRTRKTCRLRFLTSAVIYRSLDFRLASQIQGLSTHWFGGAFRLGLFNSQV